MFRGERRIMLIGCLVGGLIGGLAGLIYARHWTGEEPVWVPRWRQLVRMGALAVRLLREIAEMGLGA